MRKFLLLTVMCLFGLFTVNAQETSFFYDFNDSSLEGWNVFQESGATSPNWAIGEGSQYGGVGDGPCVYSMSYGASTLIAKNYIVTSQAYAITSESVLSWYIKHTYPGYETYDNYAVVVSTDGENFERIAEYIGEIGITKELSLANYADQTLYIGFYHYGQGGDAICIDDVKLTAGEGGETPENPEPEQPEQPEDETPENLLIVEVGADKNPNYSSNYWVPVYDFSDYAMSQQIYTAEDLGGVVGKIYSVAFKLGGYQKNPVTRQYEVYLTSTELSAFNGTNYVALSEDDKVFDGDVEIEGSTDSWYTINFDKPFDYKGGNFVLTVYDKTGDGAGNSYHMFYKYSATGRALYSQGSTAYDMLNLTTGGAVSYVNQLQLGLSVDPSLIVSSEAIALGNVKVGNYWAEEVKSTNVEVTAISTSITSVSCNNNFFVLNYDLDTNPLVINVSYDKTAQVNGVQTATITVKANDTEDAAIAVSAVAYTPSTADVYEHAQEIIFLGDAYTNTPSFANLKDDYNLPKEVNAGNTPDAVYSFELQDDATVTVNVTGTNAVAAIYNEDFNGEGGPKAKNNDKGMQEALTGPTTFFYDFQENNLEAFTLIDANNDGKNWEVAKGYNSDNYYAISYSYQGGAITPDNYMITKDVYSITATSKLTYKYWGVNGNPDYYAVVVSEDGETFESILEEALPSDASTAKTKEIDLSAYAGKALYIGFRHFNCTNQYYVCIDDLQLTDGTEATRSVDVEPQISAAYPAGKYYLVVAAEDAFTVDITLSAAPTSAPKTLTATTINETSIALAWEAVEEEIDAYNIYQNEELLVSVEANVTEYTVENLEPYTIYCYTMTAVKDDVESFESNTVCAQTYDYVITAPTNVTVTALDAFSVELTWDAVEYAQRYNIYIDGELVKSMTGNGYLLEDLLPSTEYCFEVSAVRNDQETEKVQACGSTSAIDFDDESLPAEFLFDFNDQLLDEFMLIDADGDGNNWGASSTANGYDNTYAIRSYSYWYQSLTPDNYIYTKRPYRITETSVVTLNAKCGLGMNTDLGEHYAVIVSEDGENWNVVFEETIEHAEWTNTSVSLAAYAGKGVLVGIRHYKCSGLYFLAVDNFALTQLNPPAAPSVTATAVNTSTITLTWAAVEGATSYKVYRAEDVLATVTETTYTVTGLTAETEYCFNVTAINENGESEKSADACATTLEAGDEPINPEDEVPTAPVVKAEATSYSTIVLTWPGVMTATSYKVYQGEEVLATVTETTYTVTGLTAETEYCFNVTAINANGESEKSADACATTLGDAIAENVAAFNIYPNPVSDKLYIETEVEIEEVVVYDVYGKSQSLRNSETQKLRNSIDVANLNSGVYFIMIKTNEGVMTQRFVKK